MPECKVCGQRQFPMTMADDGVCLQCHADQAASNDQEHVQYAPGVDVVRQAEAYKAFEAEKIELNSIIVTTESAPNIPILERLDIVTAEVVIGMHLFRDIASAFRDAFGGRSATMQKGLREARQMALAELRAEAHAIGADAVIAVDLDYSEISGGGKSMLFLVASGTAVKLVKPAQPFQ